MSTYTVLLEYIYLFISIYELFKLNSKEMKLWNFINMKDNLLTICYLNVFTKNDQTAGAWLNHGTKHHTNNHSQCLKTEVYHL